MRRLGLGLSAMLACGGASPGSGDDSSSSGAPAESGSSVAPDESSTTAAGSSETTFTASSGDTTGELPGYADSPCWGMPASTSVYDGTTHQMATVAATCR